MQISGWEWCPAHRLPGECRPRPRPPVPPAGRQGPRAGSGPEAPADAHHTSRAMGRTAAEEVVTLRTTVPPAETVGGRAERRKGAECRAGRGTGSTRRRGVGTGGGPPRGGSPRHGGHVRPLLSAPRLAFIQPPDRFTIVLKIRSRQTIDTTFICFEILCYLSLEIFAILAVSFIMGKETTKRNFAVTLVAGCGISLPQTLYFS